MPIVTLQSTTNTALVATEVSQAFVSNVTAGTLIAVSGSKRSDSSAVFTAGNCTKLAGTAVIETVKLALQSQQEVAPYFFSTAIWYFRVTTGGSLTLQVGGAPANSLLYMSISEHSGRWGAGTAPVTGAQADALLGVAPSNTISTTFALCGTWTSIWMASVSNCNDTGLGGLIANINYGSLGYAALDANAEADTILRLMVSGSGSGNASWTSADTTGYATVWVCFSETASTVINLVGFESGSSIELNNFTNTGIVQSTIKRTGDYAAVAVGNAMSGSVAANIGMALPNGDRGNINRDAETFYTFWFRFEILPNGVDASAVFVEIPGIAGSNYTVRLWCTNAGVVTLQGATTSAAAGTVSTGNWVRADLRVTSNGTCGLKLDGGTEVTATGTSFTQTLIIFGRTGASLNDNTYECYYDDLIITTDGFPAAGNSEGVKRLNPIGAGYAAEWVSGTGTTYAEVDENPQDVDVTYIKNIGNNKTSVFDMQPCSVGNVGGTIRAVKVVCALRCETSIATNRYATRLRSGGVNYDCSGRNAGTAYGPNALVWAVNPNGEVPWTVAAVDAIECGMTVGQASGNGRLTAVWAMVWSGPASVPINLDLTLQELPLAEWFAMFVGTFLPSLAKFVEIQRSAASITIMGTQTHPFKLNPGAQAYRRNGPQHALHLTHVKPAIVTQGILFRLLSLTGQLDPGEFFYESLGQYLQLTNTVTIPANLIPDGDTAAIPIAVTEILDVYGSITNSDFHAPRDTLMPSTALAARFTGNACVERMNYSLTHGTASPLARVTIPGNVLPPVGSVHTIQVGNSMFVGFVTNREYDPILDQSSIQMVDWRDRLHDNYLRAAFNMQEDDGRFFHILPQHWEVQRKTYLTREVGQQDFLALQRLGPEFLDDQIARNDLFSAATLIDYLGREWGFVVTAESLALQRLLQSYPLGLDFNNGSTTIINAVQLILNKCGLQFTCLGAKNMHVTIRGYSENAFSQALVNGLANICALGVSSGKIGEELNELGRRVAVIGDRNKHEWIYACRINWNPAWTWGMVFNGIELGALLNSLGLTPDNKLKELPEKYHDLETWADNDNAGEGALPARKVRNDMKIRDYLEKIAYKCYVVDSQSVCRPFSIVQEDKFVGKYESLDRDTLASDGRGGGNLTAYPRQEDYDNDEANFLYPLAKSLNTDSNLQFLIYNTTRNIIRGADFPFGVQHSLVPRSTGISLDVEEVVNPGTGRGEYRVRLFFNEPQFWIVPGKSFSDPRSVEADLILIRLCLEKNFYIWKQGEKANNLRVREQVISMKTLFKAFVNDIEFTVLRENFRRDFEKAGVTTLGVQPIRADQMAQRIATQALAHAAISRSGNLTFEDMAGTVPDGLIDSVTVDFNNSPGGGVVETVNFTSGTIDFPFNTTGQYKTSIKFRNEEEIAKDRLMALVKAAMKDKKVLWHAMTVMDAGLHEPGALVGIPASALGYAKDGIVAVEYSKDIVEAITEGKELLGGSVIVLDKPAPLPT